MKDHDRHGELVWEQPSHRMHLTSDAAAATAASSPAAAVAAAHGYSHSDDNHNNNNVGTFFEEGSDIFDDRLFDNLDDIISITDEDESTSEIDKQYFQVLQQQDNNNGDEDHHRHHEGARFLNKSNYKNHTNPDLLGGRDIDFQLAATTTFFEDPDYNQIDGQQLELHPSSSTGQHPDPVLSTASFVSATSSSSSSSHSCNTTASMLGQKVTSSNSRIDNSDANVQPPSLCLPNSSDEISPHMHLYHSDATLRHRQQEEKEGEHVGQPFGGWNVPSIEGRPSSSQNDIRSSQIDVAAVPSSLVNSSRNDGSDGNSSRKTVKAAHDSWNERFLELCQFLRENGHTW